MVAKNPKKIPISDDEDDELPEKLADPGGEDPAVVEKRVIQVMEPDSLKKSDGESKDKPLEEDSPSEGEHTAEESPGAEVAAFDSPDAERPEPTSAPEVPDASGETEEASEANPEELTESSTEEILPEKAGTEEQPGEQRGSSESDEFQPGEEQAPEEPAETPAEEPGLPEEEPEDAQTDKAVEDIVAKEIVEALPAKSEKTEVIESARTPELKPKHRHIWQKRWFWRLTITLIILVLAAVLALPRTRYPLLNKAGVRVGASLSLVDGNTQQPLNGVLVTIGEQTATSNDQGLVTLKRLSLGTTKLTIQKVGFASVNKPLVLGWGSNPLGTLQLTETGVQYTFAITDYLSGKPIENAEASSGEASAFSDKNGRIVLSVEGSSDTELPVTVTASGYRDEHLNAAANQKTATPLGLVPARKEVFVSTRNGTYDVYKADIDGKNEQLVLKGTGSEANDTTLVPSPSADEAALVSTRNNVRDSSGLLLSTLTLINLDTDQTTQLTQSERIQIVGWSGTRVIYVAIAAGASADDPHRNRLLSYDYSTSETTELASANYFNDVLFAEGNVYYAPSSAYEGGGTTFSRVSPDGKTRETILSSEIWNIFRTSYDTLTLAAAGGQDGYSYQISDDSLNKLTATVANPAQRVYVDSPDGKYSLWVDNRDGKGVLVLHDVAKNADTVLQSQDGLKLPVGWLSHDTVVFRVSTKQETADYGMNIKGGKPKKLTNLTDVNGLNAWYYY